MYSVYLYTVYRKQHTSAVCENAGKGKFIEVQRLTERCTKTVTKGLTLLYVYNVSYNIRLLKLAKFIENCIASNVFLALVLATNC